MILLYFMITVLCYHSNYQKGRGFCYAKTISRRIQTSTCPPQPQWNVSIHSQLKIPHCPEHPVPLVAGIRCRCRRPHADRLQYAQKREHPDSAYSPNHPFIWDYQQHIAFETVRYFGRSLYKVQPIQRQ